MYIYMHHIKSMLFLSLLDGFGYLEAFDDND